MRVSSFFFIRSPLLEGDRDADPLTTLAEVPEAAEALSWASPSLASALATTARGRENALWAASRYVQRMAGRPTPFSLLAGYSTGKVYGPTTQVTFVPRQEYRRIVRLDVDEVRRLLIADGVADPSSTNWITRKDLSSFPDKVRFANRGKGGVEVTTFDAERSAALDIVLELGRGEHGASLKELVGAARPFARNDEEALSFVHMALEEELLVPARTPSVLVADETELLLATPSAVPLGLVLREIRDCPLGGSVDVRARASSAGVRSADLIVDLVKPTVAATLGRDVTAGLEAIVDLLQRTQAPWKDARFEDFSRRFYERYEGRAVPLGEALDPQRGVPFPPVGRYSEEPDSEKKLTTWLLQRLGGHRTGQDLVLDERLVPREKLWKLPESFAMTFSIAGDPVSIWEPQLVGAPGTALFARATACVSASVVDDVRAFLRAANPFSAEEITCDIAYFVPGKSASFSQYPPLQAAELALTSGQTADKDVVSIAVDDVLVCDEDGTIQLRQASTRKRINVRPTNAANPDHAHTTDMFRFLHALSLRQSPPSRWSWGSLTSSPNLPRVRYGNHVISAEVWSLSAAQIRPLRSAKTHSERWDAAQAMRRDLGLPRHLRFRERTDQTLPVDLDDPWSVDAWLDIAKDEVRLSEAFDVSRSLVTGPEGPFHHEMVVPILGTARSHAFSPRKAEEAARSTTTQFDSIAPGGEVLYARIQGDPCELLSVLRDVAHHVVSPMKARGELNKWFFLPYTSEGTNEIRVRLFGDSRVLWSHETLGSLNRVLEKRLRSRTVRALLIGTYDRETYRYGGAQGMATAEKLFQVSSEIALRLHEEIDFVEHEDLDETILAHVGSLRAIVDATGASLKQREAIAARCVAGFERDGQRETARSLAAEKFKSLGAELMLAHERALTTEESASLHDALAELNDLTGIDTERWIADCLHVHSIRLRTTWHPLPHLEAVAYRLLEKIYTRQLAHA